MMSVICFGIGTPRWQVAQPTRVVASAPLPTASGSFALISRASIIMPRAAFFVGFSSDAMSLRPPRPSCTWQ